MTVVLDASAWLAFLRMEPGGDLVRDSLSGGAYISSVNLAEVLTKLGEAGEDPARLRSEWTEGGLLGRRIATVPFDDEQAERAAALRAQTRHKGLSLGDRACLALASLAGLPAYTADRSWADLAVGVVIRVVR